MTRATKTKPAAMTAAKNPRATKPVKVAVQMEPRVIRGSHSTRTEYPDGRIEFVTHWDELVRDVRAAISEYELGKLKPAVRAKAVRRRKEKPDE